jgi:hypothetical protein
MDKQDFLYRPMNKSVQRGLCDRDKQPEAGQAKHTKRLVELVQFVNDNSELDRETIFFTNVPMSRVFRTRAWEGVFAMRTVVRSPTGRVATL